MGSCERFVELLAVGGDATRPCSIDAEMHVFFRCGDFHFVGMWAAFIGTELNDLYGVDGNGGIK